MATTDAASNYLENKVLDHVLRSPGGAYTAPTTLYLALAVASGFNEGGFPGELSPLNVGYARQPITFDAAVNGATANTDTITFTNTDSDSWPTVAMCAVMDESTAQIPNGNVLFYMSLTTNRTAAPGDSIVFAPGAITISLG